VITSDGNRNPANADRSTFGRAARGRRTRPASSAGPHRHHPDPINATARPDRHAARSRSTAGVLARADADRGEHRQGRPYLRVLDELLLASCSAHHRAVRQQPDRSRSRSVEGPAAADARTQTIPVRRRDRRWTCRRAEPPARPLRTRHRRLTAAPPDDSIHRTRTRHLTSPSSTPDAWHLRLDATDPFSFLSQPDRRRSGLPNAIDAPDAGASRKSGGR